MQPKTPRITDLVLDGTRQETHHPCRWYQYVPLPITRNQTMTDSYLNFANSPIGSKLADALGLPKPMPLERYEAGQPVIKGSVLLGGGGEPQLLAALATAFKALGAQTVAHAQLPQWTPIANQAGLM